MSWTLFIQIFFLMGWAAILISAVKENKENKE